MAIKYHTISCIAYTFRWELLKTMSKSTGENCCWCIFLSWLAIPQLFLSCGFWMDKSWCFESPVLSSRPIHNQSFFVWSPKSILAYSLLETCHSIWAWDHIFPYVPLLSQYHHQPTNLVAWSGQSSSVLGRKPCSCTHLFFFARCENIFLLIFQCKTEFVSHRLWKVSTETTVNEVIHAFYRGLNCVWIFAEKTQRVSILAWSMRLFLML